MLRKIYFIVKNRSKRIVKELKKGRNPNVNEGASEYGLVLNETAPSITVGFPPLALLTGALQRAVVKQ